MAWSYFTLIDDTQKKNLYSLTNETIDEDRAFHHLTLTLTSSSLSSIYIDDVIAIFFMRGKNFVKNDIKRLVGK